MNSTKESRRAVKIKENDELIGRNEKKVDVDAYKYNNKTKSWVGPAKATTATLRVSMIIKEKARQMRRQKKEDVKINKKHVNDCDLDLESGSESPGSVADEDDLQCAPKFIRPFSADKKDKHYASWKPPVRENNERIKEFEKPDFSSESKSYNSPAQIILRLDKSLKDKETENKLLRHQLFKSHEENYGLVEEIEGHSGKHYNELVKENKLLKENLERVMKENTKLAGLYMRSKNGTLQKLDYEKKQNDKYGYPRIQSKHQKYVNADSTRFLRSVLDLEWD